MKTKLEIAKNWLPRYTGMQIKEFGDFILLTNFYDYVKSFSDIYGAEIKGIGKPMQACTNKEGLTIINYGVGSANAALIMDLLVARMPKAVLFLGKCGGLKKTTSIGHFILPIAAIRGEGTSDDYMPPEVPALPSFAIHKYCSNKIVELKQEYRTGVVYTTNRRVWEWDEAFKSKLHNMRAMAIDMETATYFIVGHANEIPRGALLLVSDVPMIPEGVKTEESDKVVTKNFSKLHLQIGIETMKEVSKNKKKLKHYTFN
ncbi:MAG: AMP nucleosidase [Ignavibacteria bacterium]|nr:AMP nucleosidase [Ignavibacteria bacterium]